MPSTYRRKRAFVFSSILLILVVAASATGLYIYQKSASASEVPARSDAKSTGTSGDVALASTKTTGKAAAPGKGKEGDEKEKAPVPVSVAAIATGPVSAYISSTANLVAEADVKVLAEAEGRVAQVLVEEGNRVGKGQVLAQLVKDDAEIALTKAQVRLENSKLNYDRAAQEVAEHLIS